MKIPGRIPGMRRGEGKASGGQKGSGGDAFLGGPLLHTLLYCGAALLYTRLLLAAIPPPSDAPFTGSGVEGADLEGWVAALLTLTLAFAGVLVPDAGIPRTTSAKVGAGMRRFAALAGGAGYDGRATHSALGVVLALACGLPLLLCGPPFSGLALFLALTGGYVLHLLIDAAFVAVLSFLPRAASRRERGFATSGKLAFTVPFGEGPARKGHVLYPAFAIHGFLKKSGSGSSKSGGESDSKPSGSSSGKRQKRKKPPGTRHKKPSGGSRESTRGKGSPAGARKPPTRKTSGRASEDKGKGPSKSTG